jgi:thiol:disulfide interchange protein
MQLAEKSRKAVRLMSNWRREPGVGVIPLRRMLVTLAVAALTLTAMRAVAGDLPAKFDPTRDAAADVAYAQALAKSQGKRVIVDVGGEWCVWCHIMDRFIAANPDVRALIDTHYVWLKVNFSKENENAALLGRWPKVEGYPHLFVLDAGGNVLHSQDTGKLEAGKSYDKRKFLDMLRKWAPPGRTAAAGGSTSGSEQRVDFLL